MSRYCHPEFGCDCGEQPQAIETTRKCGVCGEGASCDYCRTEQYDVSASVTFDSAESFEDAVRMAEGWVSDPERPGIVWRVTNVRTGETRLIDYDDIRESK